MPPTHSLSNLIPFSFNEGDSMHETTTTLGSNSSEHAKHELPALCGVVAQFPHHDQFSSMYESTHYSLPAEHRVLSPIPIQHLGTHLGYHNHPTEMIQGEYREQPMAIMQSLQGTPSVYTTPYLDAQNGGARHLSEFPQFGQAGGFASREAAGMLQTSIAPVGTAIGSLHHLSTRASASTQSRMPPGWTDIHTEIVLQGKRADKSGLEISEDLRLIDGVVRTPNVIAKRWKKMRESCVEKHVSNFHILPTEVMRRPPNSGGIKHH